jgi:hypothetical protein
MPLITVLVFYKQENLLMHKICVAIEPGLKDQFGPEIEWTLRVLLSGIGWKWEEVDIHQDCDLAFTFFPDKAPNAKVVIRASPEYWREPSKQHLRKVNRNDGYDQLNFFCEEKESEIVAIDQGRIIINRDVLFDIYWLVTGQEENIFPKDKHGFMDLTGSAYLKENILQDATGSQIGIWIETLLVEQGCPPSLPRWPDGKRAAVCLGHDVDYPEIIRWLQPLRILLGQGLKGLKPALGVVLKKNHNWHFRSWMELAKSYEMRTTFFFVPRQGSLVQYFMGLPDPFYNIETEKFREVFNQLRRENFEVGLHASYLAYQSVEKFRAEKARLEKASDGPVLGNHHHYWHMNPLDIEETLWMHEQVGFHYDSSLVHDRYIGWRRGISWPFYPFRQSLRRELRTLQVQNTWMDDQLFGNKKHNPGDRQAILRRLTERAVEQGGCITITMHEYIFDEELYPGWVEAFKQFMTYIKMRSDVWIASPGEIAEHWQKRYRTLIQESKGLELGQ